MLEKIWLLPVAVAILVPLTFLATYIMAVQLDHVEAIFPYISDTGTIPPESCIFGQLINICSVLVGLCMYLRHRQIVEFHRHVRLSNVWFLRTSTGFLWIGYVSAFGLSMVANFQLSNWTSAHILGALLAFGFGLIYIWSQTIFGYIMKKPLVSGKWITPVRLLLVIFATTFFVTMTAFGFYRDVEVVDSKPMLPPFRLKPDHPFYRSHLTSTTCEWLMAVCFVIYFLSYAFELRHAILKPPKLILNIDDEKLPRELTDRRQSSSSADGIDLVTAPSSPKLSLRSLPNGSFFVDPENSFKQVAFFPTNSPSKMAENPLLKRNSLSRLDCDDTTIQIHIKHHRRTPSS